MMRVQMIICLAVFSFSSISFAVNCADPDPEITQQEINACAYEDFKEADKKMEALFEQLKVKSHYHPAYHTLIEDAKEKWIAFREAQVKLIYPGINKWDGSIVPTCMSFYAMDLTEQTIKLMESTINTENACSARLPNDE